GKTLVAASLLHTLTSRGYRCVGMKPVASGCTPAATGLHRSRDAEALLAHSSVQAEYVDVNPYSFVPAVAPHLAAAAAGQAISLGKVQAHYERLCDAADWVVVEGVGGWFVPLSDNTTVADLARVLKLPVVLVVGMRVGCLNHALLTGDAIDRDGRMVAGWVANQIESEMSLFEKNVEALQKRLAAPLLGVVPHLSAPDPSAISAYLDMGRLLTAA
ncbi:MAG: dethiobiotin synthase, partial [Acidiferrobacterales bacterium]|nr:dethiobiotin synthase [Acidiferrobacterales bacterium]